MPFLAIYVRNRYPLFGVINPLPCWFLQRGGRYNDVRLLILDTQPDLLIMGGILHFIHRIRRGRIYDPLERQFGLDFHDQSYYVHWI